MKTKLLSLLTLLLCVASGAWADVVTLTPSSTSYSDAINVSESGTATATYADGVISFNTHTGNTVTLTTVSSYTNVSSVEIKYTFVDKSNQALTCKVGTNEAVGVEEGSNGSEKTATVSYATAQTGAVVFTATCSKGSSNAKAFKVSSIKITYTAGGGGGGSTYTVSVAATPDGYGTVSAASVSSVASGTTLSTSSNVLTVGETDVTATAASQTAQYDYAFTKWQLSDGSNLPSTVTADLSVQAVFSRTARSYDVTLNTNGGTINEDDITSYTYGNGATLPTDVTKDGYGFAGWYGNSGLTGDAVTAIANDATGDKEFWAKWNDIYSVTHTLSHVTTSSAETATEGLDYTAVFSASSGYALPGSITVTAGGSDITANCSWTKATGTVVVPAAYVTGNLVITVTGDEIKSVAATWAFSTGASGQKAVFTYTPSQSDAWFDTGGTVTLGSNLSYGGQQALKESGVANGENSTKIASSSASTGDTNAITFTITPKTGVTFTPTRVSFRATRCGTDGGAMVMTWVDAADGHDDVALGTATASKTGEGVTDPARDNNATQNWTDYSYDLTAKGAVATSSECGIKIVLNVGGKSYAIGNVVIEGTLSGTPPVTIKHTISPSVKSGQESYGSVTPNEDTEIVEGENLTVTATSNTAYKFDHWVVDETNQAGTKVSESQYTYTFSDVDDDHTIEAVFVARKKVSYTMTTAQKGTRTDDFATEYANNSDKWTAPVNKYLFSNNQTLKEWQDASSNKYAPGTEYTLTGDITLTPVFEDNAEDTFAETLEESKSDFTVTWNFGSDYGKYNMQGYGSSRTGYAVKQANVNNKSVDIAVEIDATNGKFNSSNTNNAQINANTVLTVPVVNNSVISVKGHNNMSTTTINGSTDYEGTGTTNISYTYTGETGSVDIVAQDMGYIYTLTVTYPSTFSPAPAISAGTFSFENKAYPVTITGETGTTKIETSVDGGANWTDQALTELACTVNVTAGQTLLARATVGSKEPSAEVSYTNSFDGEKSYVAWVFGKYSDYDSYDPESDGIYASLKDVYNMVPVSYASADATPSNDLKNADLLVFSEALKGAGGDVMPNKLKDFVGYVPIINMKVFNYTYSSTASSNRWGWATGESNPKTAYITPNSNLYKILDGVTFSGSKINFYSGASTNQVQTINAWQAEPTNNVDMGIGSDSQVAMHAIIDDAHLDKQFFGIGLSCDNRDKYTENAKILIKNVATVLIAGTERLDAEMATVSGTISASGWNTFSSSYPLDLSTISGGTAYYAREAADSKVTVSKTTATVPAGEGLMIKGTTEGDTFTIDVAASGTEISGNLMVGLPSGGEAPVGTYVFGWPTATPASYGFYYVNSAAAKLGAGKAYLNAGGSIGARLTVVFDEEETTGISAALNDKGQMTNDNVVYDLQGRRVAQPTKGLYIVNGRKVVIK